MKSVGKWVYVGTVVLCIIALIAYIMRGCQKHPVANTAQDKRVDSMNAILKVHDSVSFKKIDSVSKVAAIAVKAKDSLIKELTVIKGSLKGKDKDIAALIENINAAETNKATDLIIRSCDSLKWLYPIAKGLVTEYITKNDSLIAVNAKIITAKDTIIGRLSNMFSETNNTLFQVSREYSNLSTEYKKQLKKAGKRFGIGPEITLTVIGGKVTAAPGIGIHYSLLRF